MPGAPQFVLASASPRRRDLLAQIGRAPDLIINPNIDETPVPGELPEAHALRLAQEKVERAAAYPAARGAFILGADTVVACGRRILPKAEDRDTAKWCLERLSGRRHRVVGGIAVADPDRHARTRICVTTVAFKRLSREEIDGYLASGEWADKAGGYAIQGRAAVFVRYIRGSYSNVVGLPLYETERLLESLGCRRAVREAVS
ncbi:MAG: Maf family protein [Alphaproteobacteria bacterium]|nr:Maf family protein [Alphaproteobacteria bacterium]